MNDGLVLRGVNVPDWYIEEERRYLETVCAMSELEQKRDCIRQRIRERMKDEGIRLIDSGVTSALVRDSFVIRRVNIDKLKSRYPSVYEDCLGKESRKNPGLSIRLK